MKIGFILWIFGVASLLARHGFFGVFGCVKNINFERILREKKLSFILFGYLAPKVFKFFFKYLFSYDHDMKNI